MTLRNCLVTACIAVAALPGGDRALGSEVRPASDAVQRYEADRENWQRAPDVLRALAVHPDDVVADIGAGSGFFTAKISRAVGPSGAVYAVDIDPTAVRNLEERITREHLGNVKVVRGLPDNPGLPQAALDGALIADAYHEMVEYQAMLRAVRSALKARGRLVILEKITPRYVGKPRDVQTKSHHIESNVVAQELADSGFTVVERVEHFATNPAGYGGGIFWLIVAVPKSGS